jgi:arylsulfatase A-like enzyme
MLGDHGTATWQNQHVPLVVSGPGIRRGVASSAPARLVDIAPTILAAMGLPRAARMDGVVLADALVAPSPSQLAEQGASDASLGPLRDALRAHR